MKVRVRVKVKNGSRVEVKSFNAEAQGRRVRRDVWPCRTCRTCRLVAAKNAKSAKIVAV